MKSESTISDERLNALLDNELSTEDSAQLLNTLQSDPVLTLRYAKLRQVQDLLTIAYAEPPKGYNSQYRSKISTVYTKYAAVAAIFLFLGTLVGWIINGNSGPISSKFESIASLDISKLSSEKILLHINTMDAARVTAVLETAEKILLKKKSENLPLQLEIVANATGIGILRQGSLYTKKIKYLSNEYDNVSFLACGIAKKIVKLKEGKNIELVSEALDIPAALDRILNRVEHGWTYVRG